MAFSPNAILNQPSLSLGTKLYSGLKLQCPGLYATGRPNLTAEFYGKVNKSLQCGTHNHKPTRAAVKMMPTGTPKVPNRTPGEGAWQWVDIWNALYRERILFI